MPEQAVSQVDIMDLGLMEYSKALGLQEIHHANVLAGMKPIILLVEHPRVLTMGKHSDPANLLYSKDDYLKEGVSFFETERGGEVTAHVPGQQVVYPIVPIVRFGISVRSYVEILEQSVIDTLSAFNIQAHRDLEYPGVWVGHEKICAIGVRIKSRVSMHGLALNVDNELDLFRQIVPCGIKLRGVTTMKQILGRDVDKDLVKQKLVANICSKIFK